MKNTCINNTQYAYLETKKWKHKIQHKMEFGGQSPKLQSNHQEVYALFEGKIVYNV